MDCAASSLVQVLRAVEACQEGALHALADLLGPLRHLSIALQVPGGVGRCSYLLVSANLLHTGKGHCFSLRLAADCMAGQAMAASRPVHLSTDSHCGPALGDVAAALDDDASCSHFLSLPLACGHAEQSAPPVGLGALLLGAASAEHLSSAAAPATRLAATLVQQHRDALEALGRDAATITRQHPASPPPSSSSEVLSDWSDWTEQGSSDDERSSDGGSGWGAHPAAPPRRPRPGWAALFAGLDPLSLSLVDPEAEARFAARHAQRMLPFDAVALTLMLCGALGETVLVPALAPALAAPAWTRALLLGVVASVALLRALGPTCFCRHRTAVLLALHCHLLLFHNLRGSCLGREECRADLDGSLVRWIPIAAISYMLPFRVQRVALPALTLASLLPCLLCSPEAPLRACTRAVASHVLTYSMAMALLFVYVAELLARRSSV